MQSIYLDHAATTYTDERVLAAITPYFSEVYGNPSSVHSIGQKAHAALSAARKTIADILNAGEHEIYFTCGGSESDNWALIGGAAANEKRGRHIITTAIEHHAVIDSAKALAKRGFDVTFVESDKDGFITVESIERELRPDTILVSVMTANNEIGTIQPIASIGAMLKKHGRIIFHTDAVQAAGHLPLKVDELGCDMLSLSAHKFYGPKGVGVLYIRNGVAIDKFINGGAQERNRRAGTENLPGIVGAAAALRLAADEMSDESKRLTALRDHLTERVLAEIPGSHLNGAAKPRLANNVNFSFDGVEGESLILSLDLAGIAASSGSACMSGSMEPSYVLRSLGLSEEAASSSVRFTLGRRNTPEEVDYTVDQLKQIIERLRTISPF